jgi:hypothetical protein
MASIVRTVAIIAALLSATVVVATQIQTFSTANSKVICRSSVVVAGNPVVCDVYLRDSSSKFWGNQHDTCLLAFAWCNQNTQKSSPGPLRNASFISQGRWTIYFYPTMSGVTTLSASVKSNAFTVTPSTILVMPAAISGYASTATCRQTLGITKCVIKHRDAFGNTVSSCTSYSTNSKKQTMTSCSALS